VSVTGALPLLKVLLGSGLDMLQKATADAIQMLKAPCV